MKKFLIPIISVAVIALLVLLVVFTTRSRQIPENPHGTVGNLSGNLNNEGLFCESDGVVYFANTNDNHYLYRMNPNGTDATLVCDVPVAFINAAGDYVYFYYADQGDAKFMGFSGNMRGIYRVHKTKSDSMTCLDRCTSGIVTLIDNYLYYEHYDNTDGMTLYQTSLDGKDKGQLIKDIINPACVINGNIYYPNQNDLFKLNVYTPGSTHTSPYLDIQMYNATYSDDYIYYMSVNDNYCLYRYSLSDESVTKITSDRIDAFNVYDGMIFYQRNENPALIRVDSDGYNPVVIAEGNYCNINCTAEYTYFAPFDDSFTTYRVSTFGNPYAEEFIP